MKNKVVMCLLLIGVFLLTGCSHKVSIAPSLDEIREVKIDKKIDIAVGYYISNEDKKLEVVTPGGGGDNIMYLPYKDLEGALNTTLSQVFERVYSLSSINDKAKIKSKNIKYIITMNIMTNSSSTNFLIWPPTDFSIDLTCKATDTLNQPIWEETVSAKGHASATELINNFSLSAQRATEKAFLLMTNKIKNSKYFKDNK